MIIHIDNQGIKEKLKDETEIKMQVGRLRSKYTRRNIDARKLASEIMQGKAFICGSVIDPNLKTLEAYNVHNFEIFCIDVDNTDINNIISKKELMNKIYEDLGIGPIIAYDTFSSVDEIPRYRLVYQFEKPIETSFQYREMYQRLKVLYPDIIDVQCANSNRIWQGTNKKVSVNPRLPLVTEDFFVKLKEKTSNLDILGLKRNKKSSKIVYKDVKYISCDLKLNWMYKDEIVSSVKSNIDILEFMQNEGFNAIDNDGVYYRGVCPFHEGADNIHGFFVNTNSQKAYCATHECSGGDVIDITQTIYNLSFYDALQKLIKEYDIDLSSKCYRRNPYPLIEDTNEYDEFIEEESFD